MRRAGHLQDRPLSRAVARRVTGWCGAIAPAVPVLTAHQRMDSPLDWRSGPVGVPWLRRKASVRHVQPCSWFWSGRSGWAGGVLLSGRGVAARHPHRPGIVDPEVWIDHPYGEEEIALLEEELLPAMAGFLERVEAIDQAIEADQELQIKAHQAR
jgi:hypothetical protein